MKTFVHLAAWLCIVSVLNSSVAPRQAVAATTIGEHVDTDKLVHYSTGINPHDYPCARAAIITLYEKRSEIGDLNRFHPKRIFAWMVDTARYYMTRFMDFLMGLMNPDAVMNGVRKIQSMASGGNPLAGMGRQVEGWAKSLNPRSQFVLKRKIYDIIEDTTNNDGSCK